jgi:hypothetical protein
MEDEKFYRPSPFIASRTATGSLELLRNQTPTVVTSEEARRARVVVYRAYRQGLISRQTLRLVLHGIHRVSA